MKKPSILEETNGTEQQSDAATASAMLVETEHLEAISDGPLPSSVTLEEPTPTVTLDTGETLRRGHDDRIYIGEYPVVQITAHGLPSHVSCIAPQPDETTSEYAVGVNDLLLVVLGSEHESIETEAQWFSAYTYARSVLNQVTTIFSETPVGPALEYAWGSQNLLKAVTHAKEVSPLFPVQFPDAASLFAASACMQNLLTAVITDYEQVDLVPFLAHVMGGQAFLNAFSQMQTAQAQLPSLEGILGGHVSLNISVPGTALTRPVRTEIVIIDKKEEAEPLREEIVEQGKNHLQLYLALVLGAASFLAIALQPGISPFTACLLPLAALSIALKIAAHDLRPGQINFYLRRVLHSPWEIVRRILFDKTQPSEMELAILKEQGIVLTPELLNEAQALIPIIPELHTRANQIAILLFDGAAIGVLLVRGFDALTRKDTQALTEVIVALVISFGAAIPSFIVLQRKRVR